MRVSVERGSTDRANGWLVKRLWREKVSYCACGKLRMNDLVVNMADDRWPIGSCIAAHFSNFLPYRDRFHCITLVALVFLHERFWTQLFQCKFSLICCLGDNIKMIQLSHSLLVPAATRKTSTGNNFIFRTVLCKMRFLFALKIETSYCTLSSPRVDSTMIWNWYWGVWLLENCIETLLLDSFDIFIYYHHRWK